MVEAPSSNLGTSTPLLLIDIEGVARAAKTVSVFGSARPLFYRKTVAQNNLNLGKTGQYMQ